MIDGLGVVPGRSREQVGMVLRESARFIIVPRRTRIAHLRRPWRAILRQSTLSYAEEPVVAPGSPLGLARAHCGVLRNTRRAAFFRSLQRSFRGVHTSQPAAAGLEGKPRNDCKQSHLQLWRQLAIGRKGPLRISRVVLDIGVEVSFVPMHVHDESAQI
jgi:hypothetical protein